MTTVVVFTLMCLGSVSSQLSDGRKENVPYRDEETLTSSYRAAHLAFHYRAIEEQMAQQNRLTAPIQENKPIRFFTKFGGVPIGSPKHTDEIFGFSDSRDISPDAEHRRNFPNAEVEQEREKLRKVSSGGQPASSPLTFQNIRPYTFTISAPPPSAIRPVESPVIIPASAAGYLPLTIPYPLTQPITSTITKITFA